MTTEYELPNDVEAERYLLAAMMTCGPHAIEEAAQWLDDEHFYRPAHRVVFHAIIAMYAAEVRVDPVTLRAHIEADGDMRTLGGPHGGEYLMDLFALPVNAKSVEHYAHLITLAWQRRSGIEASRRCEQALMVPSLDVDETMAHLNRYMDTMGQVRRQALVPQDRSLSAVTEMVTKASQPVIPGLVNAEERVIVVGGEGKGKTTLAHQIGFAAAAGVHPFAGTAIEPQRVMIWDFENPRPMLARRFGRMRDIAEVNPGWNPDNMSFELHPAGVHDARMVFELRDSVRRFQPQLLVAGPLYKMTWGGGDNMLAVHNRVAGFFDELREAYGCTLWLEAHAPYGMAGHPREMKPEGSSMWARWCEFGIALYKATKAHGGDRGALALERFKGDREEGRVWPSWITRNPHPGWPWVANYDRDVFPGEAPPEV